MTDPLYEAYLRGRTFAKLKLSVFPDLGESIERQAAFAMGVEDALRNQGTIPSRAVVAQAVKELLG